MYYSRKMLPICNKRSYYSSFEINYQEERASPQIPAAHETLRCAAVFLP